MEHFKMGTLHKDELMDIRIYQAGEESCAPGKKNGPTTRTHYLFHYISSGKGTVVFHQTQGDQAFSLKAGQGFLIGPEQSASYISDEQQSWHYLWFEIDGLLARRMFSLAGLNSESPIYTTTTNEQKLALEKELLTLVGNLGASYFFIVGHLYLVIDILIRASATKKIQASHDRGDYYVFQALQFIEEHYQENITVEDIADFCRLNRTYLGKLFKNATGKTLQKSLIDYRLSRAADLIRHTDYPLKHISNVVGYQNQLYFSKAFKEKYQDTPREWRKKQNG